MSIFALPRLTGAEEIFSFVHLNPFVASSVGLSSMPKISDCLPDVIFQRAEIQSVIEDIPYQALDQKGRDPVSHIVSLFDQLVTQPF